MWRFLKENLKKPNGNSNGYKEIPSKKNTFISCDDWKRKKTESYKMK